MPNINAAATISDLQATVVGNNTAGDVTLVDGYAAAGDGGGGSFCFETPPESAQIAWTSGVSVNIIDAVGTPITITTNGAHGFATGQAVVVSEVGGNTAANGTWIVNVSSDSVPGSTSFTLIGSSSNGTYTSGGTASANLSVIGAANATPIRITTSGPHGYVTGQCVDMSGVGGNTAANGTWILTSPAYAILWVNQDLDTLTTVATNTLAVGQLVSFAAVGGVLPTPLNPGTAYYVVAAAGTCFQVSTTSGGSPVNLTSAGIGNLTVSVADTISNVDTVTNTLTIGSALGFIAQEAVVFAKTSGSVLPSPLTEGTIYYVISPNYVNNTFEFKVATTPGGSAVDLTMIGNGTFTVTTVSSFTLNWSSGSAAYTSGGTAATITITTAAAHDLAMIQPVMLNGVGGNTSVNTGASLKVATVVGNSKLVNQFSIGAAPNGAFTSFGTVGDGGTTIPSSASGMNAGRWRRIFSGGVDARWFGAKGDGATDDSLALQAAISALPAAGGELILPQGGSYTMGSTGTPSLGSSLRVDKPLSVAMQAGASLSGVTINKAHYTTGISPLFMIRAAGGPSNFSLTGADPRSSSITASYAGTIFQLSGDFMLWDGDCKPCCTVRGVLLNGATAAPISDASLNPITITTTVAHGYVTGQTVDVEGVLGNTNANGVWTVTVKDAIRFELNGSSSGPAYTTGGLATNSGARTFDVTGASNGSPIQVTTSCPHGYATGQTVVVSGVKGNLAANGAWTITTDYTVSAVDTMTSTLTSGIALVAGQAVSFSSSGTLPWPLVTGVTYYVTNPGSNTFQVMAARGGPVVKLGSAGSPTITVSTLDAFTLNGSPGAAAGVYLVGGTVRNETSSTALDTSGGFPLLNFQDGLLLVEDCVVSNFGNAALRIGPSVYTVRIERSYFINNYSALFIDNNAEASIIENWFFQSRNGGPSITSIGPMHRIVHNYFYRGDVGAPNYAPDILLSPQKGAWSQSGGYVWILDNRFGNERENFDVRRSRIRLGTTASEIVAGPAIVKGNQFLGPSQAVTTVAATGNGTATVTLSQSNGLSPTQGLTVGSLVTLSGIFGQDSKMHSLAPFNGTVTVTGGITPTRFQFALGGTIPSTELPIPSTDLNEWGLASLPNAYAISLENASLPWDLSGNYFNNYGVLVNDAQPSPSGGFGGSLFLDNRVAAPNAGYRIFANEGRTFGTARTAGDTALASFGPDPRSSETRALMNRVPASEALASQWFTNGVTVTSGEADPYGTSRGFLLTISGANQSANIGQIIDTTTLAQNSRVVVKFWAKAGTLSSLSCGVLDSTAKSFVDRHTFSLGPDWRQYKFVSNGLPVMTDTYELAFYPGNIDIVNGTVYLFAPQLSDDDCDYLPNNNSGGGLGPPWLRAEDTSAGSRFERASIFAGGLRTDSLVENTAGAGVTVGGGLLIRSGRLDLAKWRTQYANWYKGSTESGMTGLAELAVIRFSYDVTIVSAYFIPNWTSTLAANDNDYATLRVRKRDNSSSGIPIKPPIIASITTKTSGTGNWTGLKQLSLGAISNASTRAGWILTFDITKTGAGVTTPPGLLVVEYTLN